MSPHRFGQRGPSLVAWLVLCLFLIGSLAGNIRPSAAQPPLQLIESDDALVQQSGTWTSQATPEASGGSYLYNTGEAALSLEFSGPSLEVIYLTGPSLGTLAIEVDGTVLRTIITTSDTTTYGQRATINYLTDGPHTLNVYAQSGGVVAVDAFLISPEIADVPVQAQDIPTSPLACDSDTAIHRVSIASGGAGNGTNGEMNVAISGDGRYVVFESLANNLVSGDSNGAQDIFRRDRQTCTTIRISVSTSNVQSNGTSNLPSISSDGRYVAFSSAASNLVGGDTSGQRDVFVRDTVANTTVRVSLSTGGTAGNGESSYPSISADGRYVAFESAASNLVTGDTNSLRDIFVRDTVGLTTTRVSVGAGGAQSSGGDSTDPAISGNGLYVAFASYANLVTGDTNGDSDVFLFDRTNNTTSRISVRNDEGQATGYSYNPHVSYDGRYVTFGSNAPNIASPDNNASHDVFLRDRTAGTTRTVSIDLSGNTGTGPSLSNSTHAVVSQDGRFVAFQSFANDLVSGDTNGAREIFVRDMTSNVTTRLSLTSAGQQAGQSDSSYPAISYNGRYVAFEAVEQLVTSDTNFLNDAYVAINQAAPVTSGDSLALFNPAINAVSFIDTLISPPASNDYSNYTANPPATGRWVLGDWDGNGSRTPGVYAANGVFYITNTIGAGATWSSFWVGLLNDPPVAGRFGTGANDCIGVVDSNNFPPYGTAFALYFTCNLTGGSNPTLTVQWLSVLLPDSGGFSGTHQFGAGDFNNDGRDTIAVRRGAYVAWTNVVPTTVESQFNLAQFFGTPATSDAGTFVVGDWDSNNIASFGLFYQSGAFYRRNDLDWNSGSYFLQQVGQPIGTSGITVQSWRFQ